MRVKSGKTGAAQAVERVRDAALAQRPLELVPAILVKTREDLVKRLALAATVAKRAQVDIMDGRFVNNTTVQAADLVGMKPPLALEMHLMVEDPLAAMNTIGKRAEMFLVHVETTGKGTAVDGKASVEELETRARELGARFGLALNPKTPLEKITPHLDRLDEVLVMTVEPGFGGQAFVSSTLPKIEKLRKLRPALDIEVDGGINDATAPLAAKAGANVLVAGSAVFGMGGSSSEAEIETAAARLMGLAAAAR